MSYQRPNRPPLTPAERYARAIARGVERLPTEAGLGRGATARNIRLNAQRLIEALETTE